jgi:hypothetical protein
MVKLASELLEEGTAECRLLKKEIGRIGIAAGYDLEYTLVAGMLLQDSVILAGEIIISLRNGMLLLPLIGLRSLMESLFNVAYIYQNPKHKKETQWIADTCKDLVRRANTEDAIKQRLDEKGVLKRAEEVGLGPQYKDAYVGLSNFSHMLGFCPTQTDQKRNELAYAAAFVQTLTALLDIHGVLQRHFGISGTGKWRDRVVAFRDQYGVDFSKI